LPWPIDDADEPEIAGERSSDGLRCGALAGLPAEGIDIAGGSNDDAKLGFHDRPTGVGRGLGADCRPYGRDERDD
jgi:hypothetical protein